MTPEERMLWQKIRANKLDVHFRRQHVIEGYIADFYCHSARLAVELDGVQHEKRQMVDGMRDEGLARLGVKTLRFTNQEVRDDLNAIVMRIKEALT